MTANVTTELLSSCYVDVVFSVLCRTRPVATCSCREKGVVLGTRQIVTWFIWFRRKQRRLRLTWQLPLTSSVTLCWSGCVDKELHGYPRLVVWSLCFNWYITKCYKTIIRSRGGYWWTVTLNHCVSALWKKQWFSSGPGSSPDRGHCVVFLGKTLNSHSASLHPVVLKYQDAKLRWTNFPSSGE